MIENALRKDNPPLETIFANHLPYIWSINVQNEIDHLIPVVDLQSMIKKYW